MLGGGIGGGGERKPQMGKEKFHHLISGYLIPANAWSENGCFFSQVKLNKKSPGKFPKCQLMGKTVEAC